MMPDASAELPYEGAKEMLLVENIEDKEFMQRLFAAISEELPEPKKRIKAYHNKVLAVAECEE